ncbi:hypothetical protein EHS25_004693 [Saitozyma podzolica]|uniref:Arrestin-like N-terminal domain-containing protein n=1 Tax=Saitozyma podzolica TaxID=1890683 RepID=A0A427YUW5_9TREE|nr:hypothetical protein EHS25_004693 [Saitozyma podzolica]
MTSHTPIGIRITNTVTARLHLESHARSSTSMPLFFSSDTVRGRLEIEVKHEVKIKEIKLVAQCHLRRVDDDRVISLIRQEAPLCTKGAPSTIVTAITYSTPRDDGEFSSQCHTGSLPEVMSPGIYVIFFALALYETKRDHGKSAGRMIDAATPPPSSFFPQFSRVDISHSLGLVVDRGKLHLDSSFWAPFAFLPRTRPRVPSLLRSLAFAEGREAPDSDVDPEGWKIFFASKLREWPGCRLWASQTSLEIGAALIAMQLHLPSPLCYPRDLPVRLQARVSDPSAAWPTAAISIHLEQQLTVYGPPYHGPRANVIRRAELVRERDVDEQRWLDFDLGLGTAKPTFVHSEVQLEYRVVVRILAEGHTPAEILRVPITLVTDQARLHPQVRALMTHDLSHLPPKHERSEPPRYSPH